MLWILVLVFKNLFFLPSIQCQFFDPSKLNFKIFSYFIKLFLSTNKALLYLGCYNDQTFNRDLPVKAVPALMTVDYCLNYCEINGYNFAGLQYS